MLACWLSTERLRGLHPPTLLPFLLAPAVLSRRASQSIENISTHLSTFAEKLIRFFLRHDAAIRVLVGFKESTGAWDFHTRGLPSTMLVSIFVTFLTKYSHLFNHDFKIIKIPRDFQHLLEGHSHLMHHFGHTSNELLFCFISWVQHHRNSNGMSTRLNNHAHMMDHFGHTFNDILACLISWFEIHQHI